MTVELRPLGVKCNIRSDYCYQNPQRDAGNVERAYDLKRMKAAVVAEGGSFSLFGGEALMVPHDDLRELWSWGFVRFGRNGLQTNGVLVDDEHVRMFRKYRVHVGVSIDGPGELNDVRSAGTLERTRAATARTEATIARLCEWFERLDSVGIRSSRLHPGPRGPVRSGDEDTRQMKTSRPKYSGAWKSSASPIGDRAAQCGCDVSSPHL